MIDEMSEAWRRAGERFLAGRHLVEHRAEREDVRPRVARLALELLGRHVLDGAEDRCPPASGSAAPSADAVKRRSGTTPAQSPRQTEVEELDAPDASASRCRASGRDARCPGGAPSPARPRSRRRSAASARAAADRSPARSPSVSPSRNSMTRYSVSSSRRRRRACRCADGRAARSSSLRARSAGEPPRTAPTVPAAP